MKAVRAIALEANSSKVTFDLQQLPQKKIRELQKLMRGRLLDMEQKARCALEKSEQHNLNDLDSSHTQEFIKVPL